MEDVLEGIIVPHWSFGSVVLFIFIAVSLAFVALTVFSAAKWLSGRCRRRFSVEDTWKVVFFCLLLVLSAQRGVYYYHALYDWAYCVLRISSTPSLDVLQMGMIIQESIWLEVLRCASHAALYAASWLLIWKDRESIS